MDKLALTAAEAAEVIGVSMPVFYELCATEGFPVLRLGRKILVPKDRLRDWINTTEAVNLGARK